MVDRPGFASQIRRANAAFRARTGVPLWLPGLVCVAYYLVLHGDPFGLSGASHARSGEVALRISAPLYRASDKVVSVMVDDDYLTARDTNWPLRYAEQGAIMRRILAAKPGALVVDFVYPHRHAGAEASDAIDDLTGLVDDAEVPVIFTALARAPLGAGGGDPEIRCRHIEKLATHPLGDSVLNRSSIDPKLLSWIGDPAQPPRTRRLAYVGWSDCGDRYPNFFEGDPAAATPAFAAFVAYCETHATLEACRALASPASFLEPMTLRSGAYPPKNQAFSYGAQCQRLAGEDGGVPTLVRLRDVARQFVFSIFGDARTNRNPDIALPCPAITVVPYSHLAAASPQQWQDLLADRIVVLGASVTGIPDVVATPVHGQLAGLNWHALAIDNLLTQGSAYLHPPGHWEERIFITLLALAFAYSFPLLSGIYDNERLARGLAVAGLLGWCALAAWYLAEGESGLAFTAVLLGASLDFIKPSYSSAYFFAVVIAAVAAFALGAIGIASGNWIGLVLVVAGISHTLKSYYHGEGAKRLPHPLSVLLRLWNLGVRHAKAR